MTRAGYTRTDMDVLDPLIRTLGRRMSGHTMIEVERLVGLPNWKIGRILSRGVSNPSYLDMTKLLVFLGLTPNQAAALCGLYVDDTTADEETNELNMLAGRLVSLLKKSSLDYQTRVQLLQSFETHILAEQLRQGHLSRFATAEEEPVPDIPSGT